MRWPASQISAFIPRQSALARCGQPENAARRLSRPLGSRRRQLHGAIVFEIQVRIEVERARDAEIVIEAGIERPGTQRLVVIGPLAVAQAQVPLAYAGREVASLL